MSDQQNFREYILEGYGFTDESIIVGGAMLNGECLPDAYVKIPLKSLNRHGLIAGATGTGKTKTLQILAEQLSEKGIPSVLMDLKGDLSGLAKPGSLNKHITSRHKAINLPYEPKEMPVELMSISGGKGVKLKATVSEFGPVLFSKILDLNDTQGGLVSLIFKYADDHKMPLLDLKDFKSLLQYISNEGKEEIQKEYGLISSASVSAIIRKIIEIEQQGAEHFFGEKSFEVEDFCRIDEQGNGVISIIRLTDIQDKPKLFSTFMLSLLAEIYNTFPEAGDTDKPKLIMFIDEAHLIFNEASKALLDQIESIIKLIRSKGVGIYFCTQSPGDVPDDVLGQLGLKVQHALRAFTAKDRKEIKKAAENFPDSPFYKTDEVLTQMGIGEALITALDRKGRPTPLAVTYLRAPLSRMDILTDSEIDEVIQDSDLAEEYNKEIDRESAFEILQKKVKTAASRADDINVDEETNEPKKTKEEPSLIESLSKNTMVRQIGRTVVSHLMRGLLGTLGVSTSVPRSPKRRKRR